MPSTHEFLVLLFAIVVLWVVLKMARLAIKVILLLIAVAAVAGALWLFVPR